MSARIRVPGKVAPRQSVNTAVHIRLDGGGWKAKIQKGLRPLFLWGLASLPGSSCWPARWKPFCAVDSTPRVKHRCLNKFSAWCRCALRATWGCAPYPATCRRTAL